MIKTVFYVFFIGEKENNVKQKSPRFCGGIIYTDGLVSTGKRISHHNVKYKFC